MIFLAGLITGLLIGATAGVFAMALAAAGKRADDCRRCHSQQIDQAFREADGQSYGGTDDG